MATFRKNHSKQGRGLHTSFRMVILLILAIVFLVGGGYYFKDYLVAVEKSNILEGVSGDDRTYLPTSFGQVIHHNYYSLSYVEKYEQAEWTAYKMTEEMLRRPNVDRTNQFTPDDAVSTHSANHRDYINSGYSRGHLTPAGDMAFDTLAMRESFLMSNMSPQVKAFNNGVWKELEENIRDWTYHHGSLYIITGPIFSPNPKTIGKNNRIAIPDAFYKVVLHYEAKDTKVVAFIIPNKLSEARLESYSVSVDEVEDKTKLDFFNDMLNNEEEEKIEASMDLKPWKISEKRYQLRLAQWNKE